MMQKLFANRACGILYRFVKQYGGCYILPANVCPVVPLTLKLANVDIEFVDINKKTLCLDEQECIDIIKGRGDIHGCVFVHTYGTQYNPHSFFKELKTLSSNFKIIDDKCLCKPELTIPQTNADLTLYSTGYAKYVDLGGGAFGFLQGDLTLSTNLLPYDGTSIDIVYKNAIANNTKIKTIPKGWLDAFVTNVENKDYSSNVLQSTKLMQSHKEKLNTIYSDILCQIESLAPDFNNWRYNIIVNDKQSILKRITEANMFASSHYQPSSSLFVDKKFSNAENLFSHVINLFNDKYINEEQAKKLSLLIRDICL
jgi:hypothetical protein